MALGDEQIDRLKRGLDDTVEKFLAELRELLKGIKVNITVDVDVHEVRPPT